jgi:hypothetical protein
LQSVSWASRAAPTLANEKKEKELEGAGINQMLHCGRAFVVSARPTSPQQQVLVAKKLRRDAIPSQNSIVN